MKEIIRNKNKLLQEFNKHIHTEVEAVLPSLLPKHPQELEGESKVIEGTTSLVIRSGVSFESLYEDVSTTFGEEMAKGHAFGLQNGLPKKLILGYDLHYYGDPDDEGFEYKTKMPFALRDYYNPFGEDTDDKLGQELRRFPTHKYDTAAYLENFPYPFTLSVKEVLSEAERDASTQYYRFVSTIRLDYKLIVPAI